MNRKLKNSFPGEGDSPLWKGAAIALPHLIDSSANSALKGRDCASLCPFKNLQKNYRFSEVNFC